MRDMRFGLKARLALTWSLAAICFLSTTPWLARHGIPSGVVLAQATNTPGTPPEILGFNVSRTVLSHGRVENARQLTPINPNGLRDVQGFGDPTRGTPGLLTAIATPSPAWQPDSLHITMGWDPNFSKEPLGIGAAATNPVTMAALGIPSCFTMVVAEGVAPAFSGGVGSIPGAVHWESTGPLIGQGNLYASVSIPAAGIVAGMELRTEDQLAAYTANSIIWEAPPFGQVVQDTTLMQFGTKNITAHALDLSNPASPVMGPAQAARVEVTRTLHVEIQVLSIERNHDGSFRLCAIANLFGNSLEPVTGFWFRWGYEGKTISLVGDIPGTNLVTIPRIPAAEENQLAELYVVASCNGSTLTGDPFTAEPLGVPPMVFVRKSIGLLTFVSGGCTLEDDESVKLTPFGACPAAHAMIVEMRRTGSGHAGGENVWLRKTPAQGEITFERAEDAAHVTINENSCTFRETGPAGETYSNTITWTTPPEKMIDDGETLGRAIDKCRYKGQVTVTNNPGAYISDEGFCDMDALGTGWHGEPPDCRTINSWRPSSQGGGTDDVGFDFASPARFSIENVRRTGLYHDVYFSISIMPRGSMDAPAGRIKFHWHYEYSRNESLATITRDGQEFEAREGMEIFEADRVRTQPICKMAVAITDQNQSLLAALAVSESTEFDIRQLALGKPNRFDFALNSGEIRSEVIPERGPTQFRISSPAAAAAVTGTIFTTAYDPQAQAGTVAVEKGAVLVTPTNSALESVPLNAGQQVKVTATQVGPITVYSASQGFAGKFLYLGIGAALLLFIVISLLVVLRIKRPAVSGRAAQPGPTLQQSGSVQPEGCEKCGAPLKPAKPFCTACGSPQRPTSITRSGTRIGAGAEGGAGGATSPLIKLCQNPQCRQPLIPGKWFCSKCGRRVI